MIVAFCFTTLVYFSMHAKAMVTKMVFGALFFVMLIAVSLMAETISRESDLYG
jgi:hypothetical protein